VIVVLSHERWDRLWLWRSSRYGARMSTREWALRYAEELLAPLGDRWAHVQGVARQASRVSVVLPPSERDVLVAAAYLHDLGYSPSLVETGLHPLDGARHLRALGHERLAGLVAYHSGSRREAQLRGLMAELAEFEDEASATAMALTYCDMTTSATGAIVTFPERLADVERRYGTDHVVSQALRRAWPEIERCIQMVEASLREFESSQVRR
jgi:HD domain